MKHDWKVNKAVKYLGIALLISIIAFTSVAAAPTAANAQQTDEEKIKEVINDYFTLRYEAQKTLKLEDYSTVTDTADEVWLQGEKDRLEVLRTIAETTQFNFTDYKFLLDYQSVKITGNKALVVLLESSEVNYPGATAPTTLSNLQHSITLSTNAKGEWRIKKDDYMDDTLRMMKGVAKSDVLTNIKKNFLQFQRMSSGHMSSSKLAEVSPVSQALTNYSYSGSAATAYADANYNKAGPVPQYVRNQSGWQSSYPTSYKVYSTTDCTNFVSQAIFQGTSYTSSDSNYFYPTSDYNTKWYYKFAPTVDGSNPWVNVGGLYSFLTTNTGRGPYGVQTGTCGLAAGDTVLMKSSGAWQHAVFVRAFDSVCSYPPYAWVDAHTNNVYNAPLANYLGYTWYPVHIQGYRK